MRMRLPLAIALAAVFALPGGLSAQSTPATPKPPAISVTLVYHENNSGTFDVRDGTGASLGEPTDGDELKVGSTIVTGKGDIAELKMNHTSTIIKVSGNTNFKLEKLRGDTGGQDVFSLALGRVRTVAGRASTSDLYQIRTQTAVCGVRGSDVVVETPDGISAKLSTLEGTGWIQNSTGASLDVAQNFAADTTAPDFKAFPVPADVLQGLRDDMKFTKLDVNETLAVNKAYQASLPKGSEGTAAPENPPTPTTPPAAQSNSMIDNIFTAMHDILGFEIGSMTVSDPNNPGHTLTYAKAVFQPTFSVDKLKISLYLPVIYQGDMFNSSDWYHPGGNDEWSFGRDQTGLTDQVADFTRDLLLKIRYMEYGRQRDPFFLKVGNLDDITIGHGLVMNNFANDADFPTVRHIGLNLGVDGAGGGFEAMVNDLAPAIVGGTLSPPDIMGGRLYIRPVPGSRAALGVSAIMDLSPARDFVDPANGIVVPNPAAAGNPAFVFPGVDLDLPFVESDSLGLIFFTDGALLIPFFRTAPTDPAFTGIGSGVATKAIFDSSARMQFKNWGAAAGFMGNLVIPELTYKLQYEIYTGSFQPQVLGSGYERNRGAFVLQTLENLSNPPSSWNMGIYGEAGLQLTRLFDLTLGYFWPWSLGSNGGITGDPTQDHLVASFVLHKGVIPVVNLWGSVSYERTGFVGTIQSGGLSGALFDANTVVSAQINYPVSPIMDISLIYTVVAARDGNGNLIYNGGLIPQTNTALSIETQIHL